MVISKIKNLYNEYEGYVSSLFLLGGFVFDNLTLNRIDLWIENLVIIIYLAIALFCILFINFYHAGWFQYKILKKSTVFLSFVLQFVFGGLFSVFFIFYFRSASLGVSWFFVLILATILIGNEKLQEKYLRFNFQISIFFIAIFSYLVFSIPILLGRMGALVFILSGIFSLGLISLIVFLIFKIKKIKFKKNDKVVVSIFSIYILFNILYFTNVIPPIPLALKESNVYHSVKRISNGYDVRFEPSGWYNVFNDISRTIHWKQGMPIYFFSSVFAPTKISTDIYHCWSYFVKGKCSWIVTDKLGYSIIGGRDGGYRGYTFKYGVKPGKWHVDVITDRGQVLGGRTFFVKEVQEIPDLKKDKR